MPVRLTDEEIRKLIEEPKRLQADWRERFVLRRKRTSEERVLGITGEAGDRFRVILRQNVSDAGDFSVVLAYEAPDDAELLHLRRYNGRSHEHTNAIEGNHISFHCHVHQATERYQEQGERADGYADPTERYVDLESALLCMRDDCGFTEQDCSDWTIDETLLDVQEAQGPAYGSVQGDH